MVERTAAQKRTPLKVRKRANCSECRGTMKNWNVIGIIRLYQLIFLLNMFHGAMVTVTGSKSIDALGECVRQLDKKSWAAFDN